MLLCANYTCDFLLSVMVDREFHGHGKIEFAVLPDTDSGFHTFEHCMMMTIVFCHELSIVLSSSG